MSTSVLNQTAIHLQCHFPSRQTYRFVVATWITAVLNIPLFQFMSSDYVLITGVLLWLLNTLLVYLFTPGKLFIPGMVYLLLSSSIASYFIGEYGIVIDRSMIQNVVETDSHEALELLTLPFIYHVAIGILPLLFMPKVCDGKRKLKHRVGIYCSYVVALLVITFALLMTNYQDYSGFFRHNKQIKHMATPLNIVSATDSYIRNNLLSSSRPFEQVASNVPLISSQNAPELLVVVLGETARADHFSTNGYSRTTTPKIQQHSLINFTDVSSCGTATAHSLPCMFSWMNKENYKEEIAHSSENVFDILQRAGFVTAWYDNNSGCKHLCDRMPTIDLWKQPECENGCTDDILLTSLRNFVSNNLRQQTHGVVVLHQQGSHGPSYYKRSRPENKLFLPECTTDTFANCSQQEIINAYDNSIVETDALLDGVIGQLEQLPVKTAMLYVSDHGESLGENGVYLHGLPYWMAPESQTHVPMMLWMSPDFSQSHNIDTTCLGKLAQQPQSHDIIFSTLLNMLNVSMTTDKTITDGISTCLGERS